MPLGASRLAFLAKAAAAAATGRSAATITAVGNAYVDTTTYVSSNFGGASLRLDGVSDYLSISPNTTIDLSGDFTFECWTRGGPNTDPRGKIFDGRYYYALANTFFIDYSGTKIRLYVDGADRASANAFSSTTWVHIAVQRTGSVWEMWLNGTRYVNYTSPSVKDTSLPSGTAFYLGAGTTGTTDEFIGRIDELRISTTARYSSGASITVPTEAFINDSNTGLLVHMDGTEGSTTFIDDIGVDRSAKGISAIGNAQVVTSQSQFGGAGMYLDGTGDRLTVWDPIDIGTDPFTIEFWLRPLTNSGTQTFYDDRPSSGVGENNIRFYKLGTALYYYTTTNRITANNAIPSTLTWYHVAVSRDSSNVVRMFVNGTQVGGTYTDTASKSSNYSNFYIGSDHQFNQYYVNGWMDEFRISNVARYTSSFTPPTSAFTNDANTLILIHMDGANGSTTFTDDNGAY